MVNLRDKNGRSLYFTNRKEYYRRKKISKALKERYAEKRTVRAKRYVRYSVGLIQVRKGDDYGQTVRAEIVNPSDTRNVLPRLKEEAEEWIGKERQKGNIKGWFKIVAFEDGEEIDSYEAQDYELNKITVGKIWKF